MLVILPRDARRRWRARRDGELAGIMTEPNLLMISISAFAAVILLLSFLAAVIRLLTTIFPEGDGPDAVVLAAISAAAARAYPGTRVSRIEEER
jgi:hypothetical protein